MRFHVVSLPHTQTTRAFSHCAYTEKVRKFCTMMKARGHTVFLYAGDQNDADCDELITCITEDERAAAVGDAFYVNASADNSEPYWRAFLANVIGGIACRVEPRDFICLSWGHTQQPVAEAFPAIMAVETGIGYDGYFAKYRVWESYAWMHRCYGKAMMENGAWYDAVIPNYFEVQDFPFSDDKGDYFLFLGRCNDQKGLNIAAQACLVAGKHLIIAGHGTPPPGIGEYMGVVDTHERGKLLSKAKALLVPTQYIEPFGGAAVEAMMCGTPVITTDWGAFTETVAPGTGFRCRRLGEFVDAIHRVHELDPYMIRDYAIKRYSTQAVAPMYEAYFQRLETLWGDGWNALP